MSEADFETLALMTKALDDQIKGGFTVHSDATTALHAVRDLAAIVERLANHSASA